MAVNHKHSTAIERYYVDTRNLVPENPKQQYSLPLLATLQFSDQETVTRFIRPADKFMSLASALLKYTFIHRRAKIPWSEVEISRTPVPHRRPYWHPPSTWDPNSEKGGLEFNVSHQAGLVAIIGCSTPTAQIPIHSLTDTMDHLDLTGHHTPDLAHSPYQVRLGVDIACTDEDKRTPKDMNTQAKLDEWIEVFAEMFSDRERKNMRHAPIHVPVVEREEGFWGGSSDESSSSERDGEAARLRRVRENETKVIQLKLRRFYAYWGLKEAYIKMVGEGLLASWLKELEFLDVVAPAPPLSATHRSKSHSRSRSRGASHHRNHSHSQRHHPATTEELAASEELAKWTAPSKAERGMSTLLRGRKLEDVDVEIVAYDDEFLVATVTRGVSEIVDDVVEKNGVVSVVSAEKVQLSEPKRWIKLDIEKDIRPCAEGRCRCLD